MAEPFSLTASAFAVVGLADVVIRAGKGVYQFLDAVKDAPAEVERLRYGIYDNNLLVEATQQYCRDLTDQVSSGSSLSTGLSQALPQFTSALRSLERELSNLATLAKRHGGGVKTWAKIRYVLDQRKLSRSQQTLEASKLTLTAALTLVGIRQDALHHKRVEDQVVHGFQAMTTTLTGGLAMMTHQIQASRADFTRTMAGQARRDAAVGHVLQQSSDTQKQMMVVNLDAVKQHQYTHRRIEEAQTTIIDSIRAELRELPGNLSHNQMSAKLSGREVHFVGKDREGHPHLPAARQTEASFGHSSRAFLSHSIGLDSRSQMARDRI